MKDMKLLIDCGGSSVKIKRYVQGVLRPHTYPFKPASLEGFYQCIEDMVKDNDPSANPRVAGIAISVCGEYDYVNEVVLGCGAYPFLKGNLKDKLVERFKCRNVHIVNDGDAHALALKALLDHEGVSSESAINLSLGTAVGFGILDWRGNLLHSCHGHNWEVGNWRCDTRAGNNEQWWALGSQGLKSLEAECGGPKAYVIYGQRLCHFFGRDLVPVFHPKIIGLSGGIVAAHFQEIEEGIRKECVQNGYCEQGAPLNGVDVYLSLEKDSVMRGLACLLERDESSVSNGTIDSVKSAGEQSDELLRKIALEDVPENCPCSLLAVHAGQVICAENAGDAPLVANRPRCLGEWETFLLLKNADGSYSLKSLANTKYVSARPLPDGHLIAEACKVDAWERFELKKVPGKSGVFTLWSRFTQKYVSVDESEGNVLMANRDDAGAWEEFRVIFS